MSAEQTLDQEVRIRLLEKLIEKIDERFVRVDQRFEDRFEKIDIRFDKIEGEMKSQFHWILGTMFSLFGATLLTLIVTIVLSLTKVI